MNKIISFIIPIRHHDNAENWGDTIANLKQTLASISAQIVNNWQCTIVVNHGAKLPVLPNGVDVCYVDFPPNLLHEKDKYTKLEFRDAVKFDKGRRVLSGVIYSKETEYLMIVDDDDLLHVNLSKFVADNIGQSGWFINNGYLWGDKGSWLIEFPNFEMFCGTSFIVQRKHLTIAPSVAEADVEYMKSIFGSHYGYKAVFEQLGQPLKPVPFHAAVYRIGHSGSHSVSNGLFKKIFWTKKVLLSPRNFIKQLFAIRFLSGRFKKIFVGIK